MQSSQPASDRSDPFFTPEQFKEHLSHYVFLMNSIEGHLKKIQADIPRHYHFAKEISEYQNSLAPSAWYKEYIANPAVYKQNLETALAYKGTDPKKTAEAAFSGFGLMPIFQNEVIAKMAWEESIEFYKQSHYECSLSENPSTFLGPYDGLCDNSYSILFKSRSPDIMDPPPSSGAPAVHLPPLEQLLGAEQTDVSLDGDGERFTVTRVEIVKDFQGNKRNIYTVLYSNTDIECTVEADVLAAMIGH